MRLLRTLAFALLAFAAGPTAVAGAAVTLQVDPATAVHGSNVAFTGAVTPAGVTHVEIFRWDGAAWRFVVGGDSRADGSYRLRAAVWRPGDVVARAGGDESDPAGLRIRPVLRARLDGLAVLGASLRVSGRVRPAVAGVLKLTVRGRHRTVAVGARGRFHTRVPARRSGRLGIALDLQPAGGYARVRRVLARRIGTPYLYAGSGGPAVRFLERRLRALRYALPRVNSSYGSDTIGAVYAFQKVEGLSRTGSAGSALWRRLMRARTPRARVPRGNHIEVSKTRQVLYEVRRGKVVRIVHVSTGATGNTPVGHWRVYRKSPGLNVKGMYYSLYFLRGFALHGYHSVPPFPASHGCVRLPVWFARGLYSRWELGTVVHVFP